MMGRKTCSQKGKIGAILNISGTECAFLNQIRIAYFHWAIPIREKINPHGMDIA